MPSWSDWVTTLINSLKSHDWHNFKIQAICHEPSSSLSVAPLSMPSTPEVRVPFTWLPSTATTSWSSSSWKLEPKRTFKIAKDGLHFTCRRISAASKPARFWSSRPAWTSTSRTTRAWPRSTPEFIPGESYFSCFSRWETYENLATWFLSIVLVIVGALVVMVALQVPSSRGRIATLLLQLYHWHC